MLIQGTRQAEIKKVCYLMSFGLSSDQAHSLKRQQNITVSDNIANALLQAGFVKVIETDDKPKVKKPPVVKYTPPKVEEPKIGDKN
ncbi:hypothetical protein LCGC14_1034070 [marine sediment metagenome]|uniref:Uncharacterized protein n=1 Tax=marine sediment metagenome TaxID=412755 RepID=A0A0F9MTR2_9ZZZZ